MIPSLRLKILAVWGCVYTHEANYHPDGGHVFFPADGKPFVALVSIVWR